MTMNDDPSQSLKRKRQDELPWCLVESEPGRTTLYYLLTIPTYLSKLVSCSWQPFLPRWHIRMEQPVSLWKKCTILTCWQSMCRVGCRSALNLHPASCPPVEISMAWFSHIHIKRISLHLYKPIKIKKMLPMYSFLVRQVYMTDRELLYPKPFTL